MSELPSRVPQLTPEQRRVAAGQFEHANQVIASRRNYHYGIHLLLSCCKLDPGNLIYRQALRRTQKAKYHNRRGSWLAWLTTWPAKAGVKSAMQAREYLKALEFGEQVLCRNPWDVGTQMDMAAAADFLGLLDMGVWILEQARQKAAQDPRVNRALALLYEKRGNFTQASALWEVVRKADPTDRDAVRKLNDLAANDTLARGNYEAAAQLKPAKKAPADRPAGPVIAGPAPARVSGGTGPGGQTEASVLRGRIAADPTNVNAWMHLAGHYRRRDDFEQAHAVLREALGATGNAFEVMVEQADLEIEPFRRNLAVTEEKLKTAPDDEELKRLRLRLRKEINTRELELCRHKAEHFPGELGHRLEVGIRLLRAGLTDEAIRELQLARGDPHKRAQASYYLGLSFKSRNNWPLAQRNFDESLQNLRPEDKEMKKDLLFQLAEGLAQAGDLARAVEHGQELAFEDYAYRDIGRLLEEWQTRLQEAG